MTGMAPTRVLIADDQALVRGGFRLILETQDDIEVVGEAADGVQAVELAGRLRPNVVLMDVRMPRLDGIQATRCLVGLRDAAQAETPIRVLILTTFDHDEYVYEAMRACASGFLLKTVRPGQLTAAIRDIAAGGALLAPDITRRLIEQFVRRPPPGSAIPPALAQLTPREVDVLRLIARGLSNADRRGTSGRRDHRPNPTSPGSWPSWEPGTASRPWWPLTSPDLCSQARPSK
jgi:DNA-binding NarL/FixJ family response regulator